VKPINNKSQIIRLGIGLICTLAFIFCANTSAIAQTISMSPNPVCVGQGVTVVVYPTCTESIAPSLSYNGTPIALTQMQHGWWTGSFTASQAGTFVIGASDACGDVFSPVTLTVVQLNDVSVANATPIESIIATDYAAMVNTNAGFYVTLTADVIPNTAAAATLVTGPTSLAVPGQLFEWQVPMNNPVKQAVDISSCGTTIDYTVWIISAIIKSVAFTSDYEANGQSILLNNNSDWTDNGSQYTKPDWVNSSPIINNPICQAMNTPVAVTTTVNVQPAGLPFVLTGSSGSSFLNFATSASVNATGSDQGINLTSTGHLPNSVGINSDQTSWLISAFGGVFNCATAHSGTHKIYTTYGTPAGTAVTEKRVSFVCGAASGKSSIGDCANAIVNDLTGAFNLSSPVWGPSPIWLLHTGNYGSQCPGLALYINVHFQMLGLGAGTIVFCHANADGTYSASTSMNCQVSRSCLPGDNGHPSSTTHNAYSDNELLDHIDGDGNSNAFEAACNFNNTYYALGTSNCELSSPKGVVVWAFGNDIHWAYCNDNTGLDFTVCQYDVWTSQ